jgi:hypothetical protein
MKKQKKIITIFKNIDYKASLLALEEIMDGNKEKLLFTCCFCNKVIKPSKVDPSELSIMINFDKSIDKQCSQTFFCHADCFRGHLDKDIRMHFHLHNILDE